MLDIWSTEFWNRCFLPFIEAKLNPSMMWPCIIWKGVRNEHGYGVLPLPDDPGIIGVHVYVMRVIGLDIGSRYVLHHCDVRLCCNPWHLYLGDEADNLRDRWEHGAMSMRLTKARKPFVRATSPPTYTHQPRKSPWTDPLPA